jgi:hypothetical protein
MEMNHQRKILKEFMYHLVAMLCVIPLAPRQDTFPHLNTIEKIFYRDKCYYAGRSVLAC